MGFPEPQVERARFTAMIYYHLGHGTDATNMVINLFLVLACAIASAFERLHRQESGKNSLNVNHLDSASH